MTYAIVSLLTLLGLLGSFIFRIKRENELLKQQKAHSEAAAKVQEWADKIKETETRVKESERNCEKARNSFMDSDDSGNPPSGAV